MNTPRFLPYIVIGLYGFFYSLVISIGSVLTQEWYDENLRELRLQLATTFNNKAYATELNTLDAQKKLILGFIELVYLIVTSILIIQYSRSKYFAKSQIDDRYHISGKNVKSLISVGILGGLSFYVIIFFLGLLAGATFSDTSFSDCNSFLVDLNLCSEFLPPHIKIDIINYSSFLLILLALLQLSVLASIYPTILLLYLSVSTRDRH